MQSLRLSLFLMTVLRSTGQAFCRISHRWDLSDVFLMIRMRLWVSGRKTSKVPSSSQHIKDAQYHQDLFLSMLTLISWLS